MRKPLLIRPVLFRGDYSGTKGNLHSYDFSESYYGDRNLPVGFLTQEVLNQSEKSHVNIYTNSMSYDVGDSLDGTTIDMAFIDANHQHPWPTLDTIALLPFMSRNSIILHHDLRLFRKPKFRHGVGPKFIFDNVPRDRIILPVGFNVLEKIACNMFGVRYDKNYREYADELADTMLMPSTLGKKLDKETKEKISRFISKYYIDTTLIDVWEYVSQKL